MVGCSQPAACNLGEDKSCNGGKDASAAANCQDTDCFASSTDENVSSCCKIHGFVFIPNNSHMHNSKFLSDMILF